MSNNQTVLNTGKPTVSGDYLVKTSNDEDDCYDASSIIFYDAEADRVYLNGTDCGSWFDCYWEGPL
jgi:hypothetical protein